MTDRRLHRVTSADGTELTASESGAGPPVVLLPAGPGDAERSWRALLPLLEEHFTCHLVETRGRGDSTDHPDRRPERRVDDVRAVLDLVAGQTDEPVGLIEWGNVTWSHLADGSSPITAVVAYDPGANEVMPAEVAEGFEAAFSEMGSLVADGRLADAARAFVRHSRLIYSDEDLAAGVAADFWVDSADNLEGFLQELAAESTSDALGSTAPTQLATVAAPTLIIHGDRSRPWFADSARHVAEHVERAEVRRLHGAAHFAPLAAASGLAEEIIPFLDEHLTAT